VVEQNINPQFEDIRKDISSIKTDIGSIKATMVTKSYLDDKLADLRGDLTVKLRKEDAKVNRLIDLLQTRKVLNEQDVRQLDEFQIFPKFNT